MKGVCNGLEVIEALDPFCNPLCGLDTQLLVVKLLVDHVLDLIERSDSFLVDTLYSSHEEIVVVDGDDRRNLSNLVVEDPPGDFLGLVDGAIACCALEDTVHGV